MDEQPQKNRLSSVVTKVALCRFLALGFPVLATFAFYPLRANLHPAVGTALFYLIIYTLSIFLIFPLLGKLLGVDLHKAWSGGKLDVKNLKAYVPIAFSTSAINYLVVLLLSLLLWSNGVIPDVGATALMDRSGPLWASLLLSLIVSVIGPLSEEILSRGLVLTALAPYGKGFAIVTSALLFALGHGNLLQFVSPFLIGLLLAYVTLETGSIKTSFLLHLVVNSFSQILGWLSLVSLWAAVILQWAAYLILGVIGIVVLVRHRRDIIATLRTQPPDFIPTEHRVRSFFLNPLMLLLLAYYLFSLVSHALQ